MDINISEVKKYYGDNLVLDIDSLKINKGKITGISGANGCGKSTLLNIIAGLDDDYLGEVLYDGKRIDKNVYSNMTIVTQKPYLFKRTVFENIAYPLKLRKMDKNQINKKLEEVLYSLDIYNLKNKLANKLSGGESQKVSLARALVFNPKLLLLDEPTSNIDPDSMRVMEREIIRYNTQQNGTVIIVTHNKDQSNRLCNEVIYINRGKLST